MDCFYVHPSSVQAEMLTIEGEEFHHLARVMRKKPGEEIEAIDGEGRKFLARIQYIGKTSVECAIIASSFDEREPVVEITLGIGLLKNTAKIDWVVEKAVELGVRRISPLQCRHSIGAARIERWNKLAFAAMKQCGRSRLPEVEKSQSFIDALRGHRGGRILLCHASDSSRNLIDVLDAMEGESVPLCILIGPEGGFSDQETQQAMQGGAKLVSLGPRRLRAETAAIAALAVLSARLEGTTNALAARNTKSSV